MKQHLRVLAALILGFAVALTAPSLADSIKFINAVLIACPTCVAGTGAQINFRNAGTVVSNIEAVDVDTLTVKTSGGNREGTFNTTGLGVHRSDGNGPVLQFWQNDSTALSSIQGNIGGGLGFRSTAGVAQASIGSDGGLVLGSPTGGSKGLGTINALSYYVNGSAISASNLSDGTTGTTEIMLADQPTMTTGYTLSRTGGNPFAAYNAGATITISGSPGTATINWTSHGMQPGYAVYFTVSGGSLPTGISAGPGTVYYVSAASFGSNSFQIATTRANALAGISSITISDAGSGTFTGFGGGQLRASSAGFILADAAGNTGATFFQIGGHRSFTGTAPVLSSCGTSPSISGTDGAGEVTLGTGTPAGCTITFAAPFVSTPYCTVTWQANLATMQYTVSATAITLTQTATSSNKVDYNCTARSSG